MVKIGIIGGAGYTGGELLRILLGRPETEITFIYSGSSAGKHVSAVHGDLVGETDLHFSNKTLPTDVLFLCTPHGKAALWLAENPVGSGTKVIDLTGDHRVGKTGWVYGLPELNREALRAADRVANPGCFATTIQLGIMPLASAGLIKNEVHVSAVTGSTGAGQKPTATSHFSWRNNNISVYKAFTHQHLSEIGQSMRQLQPGFEQKINFIPFRGNFSRGIMATSYTDFDGSLDEAQALYRDFYADAPFAHLVDENPHLKQIVNTNKGLIYLEKHEGKLFIISIIDNLVKGASGQAVQNLNLITGAPEDCGLRLKPSAF